MSARAKIDKLKGECKMNYKTTLYEKKDRIAYITINEEQTLNAMSKDVITDLFNVLTDFRDDASTGVAILTGKGRSFVAGGNLAEMLTHQNALGEPLYPENQKLSELMEDMGKPIIAAVNGFAFGGGTELAMCCDMRVASTKAQFGQLEINMGIMPLLGGTKRLPRLVGIGMAKYLIFSGDIIKADEAYRIGLVEKVVEPEELIPECERIAKLFLSKSQVAIKFAKVAVNFSTRTDLRTGLLMENYLAADVFRTEDRIEGISSFLEKRKPDFKDK